jgi:CBS domain-containing protein
MLVQTLMPTASQRLVTIEADAPLTDAAKLLSDTQISLVVVCAANGAMAGVITKTDVVRQIAQGEETVFAMPVSAIMTKEVVLCHANDLLQEVLSNMRERGFVHIPVVDQHFRPCGVINARDALRFLLREAKDAESLIRDYVMGIGYH